MDLIKNLQGKSLQQKRKILIISLVILMLMVVLVWIWQIKDYSYHQSGEPSQLAPLSDIKDQMVDLYTSSSEKVKNLKGELDQI